MLKSYLKLIKNIFQVIRGILSYYHKDKYFYIKIYSILNIFSFKKSYYISLRASETGVAIGHQMTANCCSRPLSSLRGNHSLTCPDILTMRRTVHHRRENLSRRIGCGATI